jgi:hypothetical protein
MQCNATRDPIIYPSTHRLTVFRSLFDIVVGFLQSKVSAGRAEYSCQERAALHLITTPSLLFADLHGSLIN